MATVITAAPTKPAYAAKAAATTNSLADDVELITAPEYTGLREPAPEAASIHKQGKRVHGGGVAASLLALPLAPLTGLLGLTTVREMTEVLIFRWGRYESTLTKPGMYWNNVIGRTIRTVSTAIESVDLPSCRKELVVLDAVGNPLVVSGVIVYQVEDTYLAAVATRNYRTFIETQGEAVLKSVISQFPYEAGTPGGPCLQRSGEAVNEALRRELQHQLTCAGINVRSFVLKEISYAPVIAAAMLKRQQAQAMVEARQTIVKGAVEMSVDAIEQLRARGVTFDDGATSQLVSNLMTVICSESEASPTLPLAGK